MQLFGIINLTPDSFSNKGEVQDIYTAKQMLADGASFIDVGAESTRPGASIVSPVEEWRRLEDFLKQAKDLPISLDTRNFETAQKALPYIKILNDVSGFTDPRMAELAANNNLGVIAMHSLTVPSDKNIILQTEPVTTLKSWIQEKFKQLTKQNIKPENIIFDIGLGFGKNPEQNTILIQVAPELAEFCHNLGTKILYGHSRKSFLQVPESQKDIETAKITRQLAAGKVDFARVHAIKLNLKAIKTKDDLS